MTRQVMTRKQFFQLCEEMRNRREWLTKEQPRMQDCLRDLSAKLGFTVNDRAIVEAQEITQIHWQAKRRPPRDAGARKQRTRTIMEAILDLYRRLGEPAPAGLLAEYQLLEGRPAPGRLLHPSQTFEPPAESQESKEELGGEG